LVPGDIDGVYSFAFDAKGGGGGNLLQPVRKRFTTIKPIFSLVLDDPVLGAG